MRRGRYLVGRLGLSLSVFGKCPWAFGVVINVADGCRLRYGAYKIGRRLG